LSGKKAGVGNIRGVSRARDYSLDFLIWRSAAIVAPRPRKKKRKSIGTAPFAVGGKDSAVIVLASYT
jgi:hypothetical protein